MLSKSSKRVLTRTAIIVVSGYLLYYCWMIAEILIFFIGSIMDIADPPPKPTDKQMIEHFRQNEKSFDRLVRLSSLSVFENVQWDLYSLDDISTASFRSLLENDPLYYYNLLPAREENDDVRLLSPSDREKERRHLMEKLKIESCAGINPARLNSIEFIYFYNGISFKGFEYVFDRIEEFRDLKIFIKTEEDLNDVYYQRYEERNTLCKKIDDHWNLFISK